MEGIVIEQNFERGPSKDHSSKVWSKLALWFLRRRLKCEKLTTDDGRKKPDGKSSHGLWPGELKTKIHSKYWTYDIILGLNYKQQKYTVNIGHMTSHLAGTTKNKNTVNIRHMISDLA